jgi:ribose 1,5-bisphosphokinase
MRCLSGVRSRCSRRLLRGQEYDRSIHYSGYAGLGGDVEVQEQGRAQTGHRSGLFRCDRGAEWRWQGHAHPLRARQTSRRFVFVRRTITRAADAASEDHDTVDDTEFERLANAGAFAVHWEAHGLSYGLPSSIDDDIAAGRVVVANISRGVLADLQRRYARVVAVAVTADRAVLRERLMARGREEVGDIERRVARISATTGGWIELRNSGPVEEAGDALVAILRSQFPSARATIDKS